MKQIVVATGNSGKLIEIKEILSGLPFELVSMRDLWDPLPEIEETGSTFLENARIKADWVYSHSGLWALADDSGLEVDFLNGAPGVLSARYAGSHGDTDANNRKLLSELTGVDCSRRTARFRCAITLKIDNGRYIDSEGICEGSIGMQPLGSGGFGYDPLFIPAGESKTFAQLESEKKHLLSHRGIALNIFRKKLDEFISFTRE